MRVTASVVRVPWHTDHGGYDRLLAFLPEAQPVITPPAGRLARRAAATAHRAIGRRCPLPFYPPEHFATDWRIRAARGPAHVLYGDEQFWFSRRRTAPTAVTYHQPPAQLQQLLPHGLWKDLAPRADRVITLDPYQREFFTRYLPPERVHLVPHGIDTHAFTPAPSPPAGPPLVLTVGWWLRDWNVLDAVHARLHHRYGRDVELTVVTRQAGSRSWPPATRILQGITEEELIGLYRRAAVVLLPLTGATANNALLEALACGTPVVASAVGGIPAYAGIGPGCLLVPPGDPAAATEAVEKVISEAGSSAHAIRRAAARDRAEHFAWPHIADQTRHVYQLLAED
ncbi:Glycosyltransferase involved in cell wall bisynthesis [Streptomyces aidingensis]|uniref:Glycosyltransferase involved in cell wall bisynthesis n=1 Tax=Streptomyces aidingensis TaxID=910347 RepID=A0A1I1NWP3_9ACTN|nr:Glycosyltransferase involved in cell wall bisynthesis [Streptomyces aidingensis]